MASTDLEFIGLVKRGDDFVAVVLFPYGPMIAIFALSFQGPEGGLTTTVTTPVIYALGTTTTVVSFAVMGTTLATVWLWRRARLR